MFQNVNSYFYNEYKNKLICSTLKNEWMCWNIYHPREQNLRDIGIGHYSLIIWAWFRKKDWVMAKDKKNEAGFIFSEPGLWEHDGAAV